MIHGEITQRGGISGGLTAGVGGTTDYNELENRPSVNNIILEGNKNGHDLGLANLSDIPVYNILIDDIILWTNPTLTVTSGNITLLDKLKNYDYFYFDYYSPNDGQKYTQCSQTPLYPIPKSNNSDFIHAGSWAIYPTYGNRSLDCYCDDLDSTTMYLYGSGQWDWPLVLYRIHGVKHRITTIV